MSSKIANLVELESVLNDNERTDKGVLEFIATFKISRLLDAFNMFKTKGISVSTLLTSLIIFRLRGESIPRMVTLPLFFLPKIDDNTFYRLINNWRMDWRRLLMGFAKQFVLHTKQKGDINSSVTCFVLDDTDLPKTGKTIEFIGKIFNHVTRLYPLGFKMLLLSFWDGKSLIPVDFSLHREKGKKGNFGLTAKERKSQFRKVRDVKSPSFRRVRELDTNKNKNAIAMLKRAVKNGFISSYVLMDSWFVNDYIIKNIRAIRNGAIHVLGMCKMDNRKYLTNKRELNIKQIIVKNERKNGKYSRKYKSRYITISSEYKGEIVRLFCIRYNNSKNWTLLLTTDMNLSFVQAIELYQIRWTIEVFFKECKQYLRLGSSQNTDFDGQIGDTTLTLITHVILTLQRRFASYETMGELFRETQMHLLELTLWERLLKVFIKMLRHVLDILNVDIDELMEKLMQNNDASCKLHAMLSCLSDLSDNEQNEVAT